MNGMDVDMGTWRISLKEDHRPSEFCISFAFFLLRFSLSLHMARASPIPSVARLFGMRRLCGVTERVMFACLLG
jgi:hypothetical protein